METFNFTFEEIPLCIGKDNATGKKQQIALITGACEVDANRVSGDDGRRCGWEWEISEITLSGPILYDPDVTIKYGHPLWEMVVSSIKAACGDEIWNECQERGQPDPDHMREMRREWMEMA